jgi:hypothetical protein
MSISLSIILPVCPSFSLYVYHYMYLSIHQSTCPSVILSTCLPICLFILSVYPSVYHHSACLSVFSIRLSIHQVVCLYIRPPLSLCLSVCPFFLLSLVLLTIFVSISLPVCLSFSLSVLSICLSVHKSVCPSHSVHLTVIPSIYISMSVCPFV